MRVLPSIVLRTVRTRLIDQTFGTQTSPKAVDSMEASELVTLTSDLAHVARVGLVPRRCRARRVRKG